MPVNSKRHNTAKDKASRDYEARRFTEQLIKSLKRSWYAPDYNGPIFQGDAQLRTIQQSWERYDARQKFQGLGSII